MNHANIKVIQKKIQRKKETIDKPNKKYMAR